MRHPLRFCHNPLGGTSRSGWSLILLALLVPKLLTGQSIPELGTVRRQNWLSWDYPWAQETNVVGFRIYLSPTNVVPYQFQMLGDLVDQRWPGTNSVSGLNGTYAMAVTAVARLTYTNLATTNFTTTNATTVVVTNLVESDPSMGLVTFRDGVPIPPGNVQLYTVLQLAATNAIPPAPFESLVGTTFARKGPEYELSGR